MKLMIKQADKDLKLIPLVIINSVKSKNAYKNKSFSN